MAWYLVNHRDKFAFTVTVSYLTLPTFNNEAEK